MLDLPDSINASRRNSPLATGFHPAASGPGQTGKLSDVGHESNVLRLGAEQPAGRQILLGQPRQARALGPISRTSERDRNQIVHRAPIIRGIGYTNRMEVGGEPDRLTWAEPL